MRRASSAGGPGVRAPRGRDRRLAPGRVGPQRVPHVRARGIGDHRPAQRRPQRAVALARLRRPGRARRTVWELLNRLAQVRLQVAETLDRGADNGDADMQSVISQRRSLAPVIGRLPIDDDQMRRRDRQAENKFQNLSQTLQRDQQRVESLEAMIVAIERYLNNPNRPVAAQRRPDARGAWRPSHGGAGLPRAHHRASPRDPTGAGADGPWRSAIRPRRRVEEGRSFVT